MKELLAIVAVNAATAALLALAVAIAGRYLKRPAILHALWIIVLLELLIPPVFEIGILPGQLQPSPAPAPIETAMPATTGGPMEPWLPIRQSSTTPVDSPSRPTPAAESRRPGAAALIGGAWLVGASLVFLLAAVRIRRFKRLVRDSRSADDDLQARVDGLAGRMGLARSPKTRRVRGRISPMIWPRFASAELLFPDELLDRLADEELDALLTHELAHVSRRDHWVRYLELVAGALFWWHPVVWWVRSKLHHAEERCCDQLVMGTLPSVSRHYARGLLKTVEFLAGSGPSVPALASGIGEARNLEERLTMILNEKPPRSLARPQKAMLAAAALGLLLVFPTWAERAANHDAAAETPIDDEDRFRTNLLELEQRALQLEESLREVRAQQMALEHEWRQTAGSTELERLRYEAASDEAHGRREQALALRRDAERAERQVLLEHRMMQLERERTNEISGLEMHLRKLLVEIELLEAAGNADDAEPLRQEAGALKLRLDSAATNADRERQEFEREMIELDVTARRAEIRALGDEGRMEDAARAERDLARALAEFENERQMRAREQTLFRLETERSVLADLAAEYEASGRADELREMMQRLEDLEREARRGSGPVY